MQTKLIASALFVLLSGSAGGTPLDTCSRPLRVGFYPIPPLYYQIAGDPAWRGLDKDVVDELGRRTGCQFEAVFDSRIRIWTAINAGKLDLTVSGIRTPERERIAYIFPYMQTRNMLVIRDGAPDAPQSGTEALASPHLTLAATRGYRYGPPFDAWIEALAQSQRLSDSGDEEAGLRLLAAGRVDTAIVREAAWDYYFTRGTVVHGMRLLDAGAPFVPAGLVLSRTQIGPQLAERFAETLGKMKQDGTLERLARRHMSAPLAQRAVDF
ncbi:transporter substrate-binding domain-containing protein [Niveibacterium sp. 24ML]|uniref:substrate-binding periplasmic protein n=1 Tax=Niveibacterium sp. 24ML TaxID=2985512 RepID=UPI00226F34B0|nr:transporter substrate-binding domain-containing protein [Niveibacterium sp. 24ML]MCX9157991.1 transporter substrate-binding domain-containing protein [Niveibacterium sp. 24ML]